jgi:hypothetical protein
LISKINAPSLERRLGYGRFGAIATEKTTEKPFRSVPFCFERIISAFSLHLRMSIIRKPRTRSAFRDEEDDTLRSLVAMYGDNAWGEVVLHMPGRNVRQCRERWKHYLSGVKLRQPWTPEEDRILAMKVREWGTKWTRISEVLGDRTDMEAKSRWLAKFGPKAKAPNRPPPPQFADFSSHVSAPTRQTERPETAKQEERPTILTQDPEEMEITERVFYLEWETDFFI